MSRLRHIASFLFLLLSLQVVIPAQLWHGLCDHEDTIDCCLHSGNATISVLHDHCLVLELSLPTIEHKCEELQFSPREDVVFLNDVVSVQALSVVRANTGIRGPPFC